jgi:hypothetical protein
LSSLIGAAAIDRADGLAVPASPDGARLKLLSKEVVLRHQNKRPPVTGFVTYISTSKPVLMHGLGWQDYSETEIGLTTRKSKPHLAFHSPFGYGARIPII